MGNTVAVDCVRKEAGTVIVYGRSRCSHNSEHEWINCSFASFWTYCIVRDKGLKSYLKLPADVPFVSGCATVTV